MVVEIHSLPSSNQDDQSTGDRAILTENPAMEQEVDTNEGMSEYF